LHDLLQIFVTALHLVCVNLATGGPLLALGLYRRALRRDDAAADATGRRLLRASLHGLYAGLGFGALSAWLWWQSHPRELASGFNALPFSKFGFGALEFVFSAACFEIWLRLWRRRSPRVRLTWFIGFLGVTNTVYHFPTLFSILSVLTTRSLPEGTTVRFVSMLADIEVLSRVFHFLLASLAVAGATLCALATTRTPTKDAAAVAAANSPESPADPYRSLQFRGALWALATTLLQWPVGVAVLLLLPATARDDLLGDQWAATMLFGLSMLSVLMLMHRTAAAVMDRPSPRVVRSILLWLGTTIVLMTAVRHFARESAYGRRPWEVAAATASDFKTADAETRRGSFHCSRSF
jgi:hypothetical protein